MSDFIQVMGGDFPKGITLELEKDYFVFRTGFFKKEKVARKDLVMVVALGPDGKPEAPAAFGATAAALAARPRQNMLYSCEFRDRRKMILQSNRTYYEILRNEALKNA